MTNSLLFLAGCALLLLGGHLGVAAGIAGPRRGHESGWPQARPVRIATVNRRQLAALRPARYAGAPVLLMMHGWGGNGSDLVPAAEAAMQQLRSAAAGCPLSRAQRFGTVLFAAAFCRRRRRSTRLVARQPSGQSGCPAWSFSGAAACILVASRRDNIAAVVSISAFAHPEELMQRWLASQGRWLRWLSPLILGHVRV